MKQNIPQFGLYGEERWIDNPDFVHIEDIAARSSELSWHIKAHQHTQLLQILLLKSGSVQLQMDTQHRTLEGCWGIVIPPGTVHGFRFAPHTDGRVLSISDTVLSSEYAHAPFASTPGCFNLNQDPEDFAHLWQLINVLDYEFHQIKDHKNTLIEHLLKTILVFVERHYSATIAKQQSPDSKTLQRLKHLVNQHVKDHWKLVDYATQLNVSEKKLNRLTQQAYGKTVMQLTHEQRLLEAKRSLIYTQKPVEQIAYDLGFKDPGYFSRFFKRCENCTPGHYRQHS